MLIYLPVFMDGAHFNNNKAHENITMNIQALGPHCKIETFRKTTY